MHTQEEVGQVRNSPFFADLQKKQSRVHTSATAEERRSKGERASGHNEPEEYARIRTEAVGRESGSHCTASLSRPTMASFSFVWLLQVPQTIRFFFRFPCPTLLGGPPPVNDHPISRSRRCY